jgi:hypothetical protein
MAIWLQTMPLSSSDPATKPLPARLDERILNIFANITHLHYRFKINLLELP